MKIRSWKAKLFPIFNYIFSTLLPILMFYPIWYEVCL